MKEEIDATEDLQNTIEQLRADYQKVATQLNDEWKVVSQLKIKLSE